MRACTQTLRGTDEIVVDATRRDEELLRMMARFADVDSVPNVATTAWREPPPRRDERRPPPAPAAAWRDPGDVLDAPRMMRTTWRDPPDDPDAPEVPVSDEDEDDDFDLGGGAPWDVIQ